MKRKKALFLALVFGFLLGIYEGKVALWVGDDPQPFKVFPYSASILPENDRQKLEEGIRVESREDLSRLLEDYLS